MGMFDWVRSSYQLPTPFMGVCQTKDIEDGFGGTMSQYWIDPAGYLWAGTYTETHSFEDIKEDDPKYNPDRTYLNHKWVPTGKHGKWSVHPITKYIEIYPSEWNGEWEDWPRLRIHFRSGKVQDVKIVTGR